MEIALLRLVDALRLNNKARIALVGAGGKSSALFRLRRELAELPEEFEAGVWLSATTHLSSDQLGYADQNVELGELADFKRFMEAPSQGSVLFTGQPIENGRTAGVSLPILDELKHAADARGIPVILEADGSRRLPLKAPASHEPVIPAWVDQVVVVAGLSALGKPLTQTYVHRPEIFAQLSGLSMGEEISREALARVLINPSGGLKGIPEHARRVLLLNQARSTEQQAAGYWIATQLQDVYQAVILAQLQPPVGSGEILAVHERVAGVVLAAGASTRLGRPKQLLPWRNHPLVYHAARIGLQAGLSPMIVVTGSSGQEVAREIERLPVKVVDNPAWSEGQSSSVIAAVKALPDDVGAVVFLLSDQPLIPADLVRDLAALHAESLAPIVAPLIQGKRANPVLFDRKLFPELSLLSGDKGGRDLFSRYAVKWLEWHEAGVDLDIDTDEDYQRLISYELDNREK